MDLDDSFTEKAIQRHRARKELLHQNKIEVLSAGKKRSVLTDEYQVNSDEPPSKSPKRSSALTFQGSSGKENLEIEEDNFVPIRTNNRGLAALRKKGSKDEEDYDNFKSSHEHLLSEPKTYVFSTNTKELCAGRSARIAKLAANIKQWEDELPTPSIPTKSVTPSTNATNPASQNTFSMKLVYTEKRTDSKEVSNIFSSTSVHTDNKTPASIHKKIDSLDPKNSPKKLLDWNAAVAATLETSLPVAPNMKTKDVQNGEFSKKWSQPNTEPRGSDESIDENDFAENYNIMSKIRGDFKEEMDYSPFKGVKEIQKKIEAKEGQRKAEPTKFEAREDQRKIEPTKIQAREDQKNTEAPEIEAREDQRNTEIPKMKVREIQKQMEAPKIDTSVKRTVEVDPAELPLSARRALFEKKLISGTPKVNEDECFGLSIAQRAAMFENAAKMNCIPKSKAPVVLKCDKSNDTQPVQPVVKADAAIVKAVSPVKKISPPHTSTLSPTKRVGNHVFLVQQKLAGKAAIDSHDEESEDNEEISSMDFQAEEDHESDEESENCHSDQSMEDRCEDDHPEELSSSAVEDYPEESHSEFPSSVESDYSEMSHMTNFSSSTVGNNSEMNHLTNYSSSIVGNNSEMNHLTNYSSSTVENLNSVRGHSGKSSSSSVEKNFSGTSHLTKLSSPHLKNSPEMINSQKFFSSSGQSNSETDNLKKLSSCSEEKEVSHSKKSSSSSMEDNNLVFYDSKKMSSSSVENNIIGDSSYSRQSCTSDSSAGSYSATSADGEDESENKKGTPLLYTVSFYRKQKQESRLTPVQKIIRKEKQSSTTESPDAKYTEIIQERIKCLQDEILRQQTVISQTSQALNLCSATLEFSGSSEQVEGERLLLIATQKRQACLNEITRLKTFGAQGESVADDRGTMTISDIILPLKKEFVASQLQGKDDDTVHYFLCLIRHGAQVIVTQMMSTDERSKDGLLVFTNHIQLQDLPPTFSVIFEVYALQTKKEVLPHEKKYHIKRETSKIRLTPKSKKNNEKMMFPSVSSPGGPNAVRSPCFGVVGFTRFTLQNCNKTAFTLDKVPFSSPLEGILKVKLQLHAEHKVMERGFLTLFDDISGYGAWLRRWCVLDANGLAMWKYPDDENEKEPAAIIDLKQCITPVVKPVARNICARPHTFQLITMRPHEEGDQPTLVSKSVNTFTSTKHLLSADTKEERIIWCEKINEALNNVRKWNPQAIKPIEGIPV